jgi:hypothetical protein
MAITYESIATVNINGVSETTFSSISGTYTDLILVGAGITRGIATSVFIRFNGDTNNNYSYTLLYGDGTSAASSNTSSQSSGMIGAGVAGLSSTPTMILCQIQNYSNATTYKTYLSRDTDSNGSTEAFVGLWRSTAAITSVTVRTGGNFTGGNLTLYGIKSA